MQAIEAAGYRPGEDIFIAFDAAASEFYENGVYELKAEAKPKKSAQEMIEFYSAWADRYPLISIEDGLAEERLGQAGRRSPKNWGRTSNWSETISSLPTRKYCQGAYRKESPIPS